MSVDYESLKSIVNNTKFEYYEELSYNGVNYLLFICEYEEREREEGLSPVFYRTSQIENWDIYFSVDVIKEKFRKPVLLHEILEAERCGEFLSNGMEPDLAVDKAHKIAKEYDDRFAREILSEKDYLEYCQFRNKWISHNK